jgi:hypothetical protein
MSFTNLLRSARSSRVSTFHKFLTHYDPNSDRIFAFVEGEADEAFYRAQIQKYVADQRMIYVYNCDGKKNVCDVYAEVVKKYPQCERVLFFLDKDLDDIVSAPWPADPRIFVTECYSIENYVVSQESIARYYKDFVKIRRVDVELEAGLSHFDDRLRLFHRLMLPIMAWIVMMKRAGFRVNLHDVNLGELFHITDDGTFRKPKRCAVAYLGKVTQATPSGTIWKLLKATCIELRRLPAKSYVRGKFEAWWFVSVSQCILDGLKKVVEEANGSIKVHAPLTASTFIQLLSGGTATPGRLDAFLTFHTNRGGTRPASMSPTEDAGMFGGIFSFFKRW